MILEAHALSIGYRGAVIGESLDVAVTEGRVLALLGPNGGGKTTLLKTLLGLIPALGGDVRLEGRRLAEFSVRERARRVAYVPQVHAGTFGFTVEEVALMGRTAHSSMLSRPSAHDRDVTRASIAKLGIAHLADRPYTLISGGERQLVLIARALAQEPRIVVLDEPTANLDFGNQGKVLREMRALAAAGLAVLFTTHDPNHALRYADDVLLLRKGKLVARGEARTTLTRDALRDLYGAMVDEVSAGDDRAFLPG